MAAVLLELTVTVGSMQRHMCKRCCNHRPCGHCKALNAPIWPGRPSPTRKVRSEIVRGWQNSYRTIPRVPEQNIAALQQDIAYPCRPSSVQSRAVYHAPPSRTSARTHRQSSAEWLSRSGRSARGLPRARGVWPSIAAEERWGSVPEPMPRVPKRAKSAVRACW